MKTLQREIQSTGRHPEESRVWSGLHSHGLLNLTGSLDIATHVGSANKCAELKIRVWAASANTPTRRGDPPL